MKNRLLYVLLFLVAACKSADTDLEDLDLSSAGRGGRGNQEREHVPGEPDRHWVPGCESSGASGEKNPHCVNPETIELVSEDPRFKNLHSVATDGEYLYVGGSSDDSKERVWRVRLADGEVTELFTNWWTNGNRGGWAFALEVVGDYLYVADPNSGPITDSQILRGFKDGRAPLAAIYTESRTPGMTSYDIIDISGLATDGSKLYATDHVHGRVSSLNADGSAMRGLSAGRYGGFFDVEHRNTVAYYGSTLFVADSADRGNCNCGNFTPEILALPAEGGSFVSLYSGAPLVHPLDIEVDARTQALMIVDKAAGNAIFRLSPATNTLETVHAGDPFKSIVGIAISGDSAYIIDTGDELDSSGQQINGPGRIYRVPIQ